MLSLKSYICNIYFCEKIFRNSHSSKVLSSCNNMLNINVKNNLDYYNYKKWLTRKLWEKSLFRKKNFHNYYINSFLPYRTTHFHIFSLLCKRSIFCVCLRGSECFWPFSRLCILLGARVWKERHTILLPVPDKPIKFPFLSYFLELWRQIFLIDSGKWRTNHSKEVNLFPRF